MIPLDNEKPNKKKISNYRPVSVLNTFDICLQKKLQFTTCYYSITRRMEKDNLVVAAVSADMSKAFDCILHDLLIAKLAAYGLSEDALMHILSYLSNRKQCVRINDTYSEFENIIMGVPQGSILGPLLFILSIKDLFFFILIASVHNFADDNTLSAFAQNVSKLINILQSESEVISDWFKKKQMTVNPYRFQVIIMNKKKGDHTNENLLLILNKSRT